MSELQQELRKAIASLAEGKTLSEAEATSAMEAIMSGEATPAQVAGFAVALRMKGETVEEVAGAARAMRAHLTKVDPGPGPVVDTAGTGGDGSGTFNISTSAAILVAACGVTVAKHGNRSVSSRCGSADVLASLGIQIEASVPVMERCLRETKIAFLFAQRLHPAMKYAAGPRRELGIRTLFNLLGPLVNPASADRQLVGVFSDHWLEPMAEVLGRLGATRAWVVHGEDGLDELSLCAPTQVAEWHQGRVQRFVVNPESLGLSLCSPEALAGGDAKENAAITRSILEGEAGPRREITCLNAAAALCVADRAKDLPEGLVQARAAIDSGAAKATLEAWRLCSHSGEADV